MHPHLYRQGEEAKTAPPLQLDGLAVSRLGSLLARTFPVLAVQVWQKEQPRDVALACMFPLVQVTQPLSHRRALEGRTALRRGRLKLTGLLYPERQIDMSVTVRVVVEDVTTRMLTYDHIQLASCATVDGSYSIQGDLDEALVALTYYYEITDPNGTLNTWYKYRFHHDTGDLSSSYSDPFRVDGVTRLRTIQKAMEDYGAGMVVLCTSGCNTTSLITTDSRLKSTAYRDNRGKGAWVNMTTGARAGDSSIILSSDVSAGDLTVNPALGGSPADGDQFEWHWLAGRTIWNNAFNRAMARYYYPDRVPVQGVANQEEYDLSGIPWIRTIDDIFDVTWYPTSGHDVEESYGVSGRWWKVRVDREKVILTIYPTIAATTVLYLHTVRPMPSLYTDASAAPLTCAEELAAALTYDEVLAFLYRYGSGTVEERNSWGKAKGKFKPELRRLLNKYRPQVRHAPAQLPYIPVVPRPTQAR